MSGGVYLEGLRTEAETQRMNVWIDGKGNMLAAQCLGHLAIDTSRHVTKGPTIGINYHIAMEVSPIRTNRRNTAGKTYLGIRPASNYRDDRKAIQCAIWRKSR